MPERPDEFSAPAPPGFVDEKGSNLTNEDFRKLMMTPRVPSHGTSGTSHSSSSAQSSQLSGSTQSKHNVSEPKRSINLNVVGQTPKDGEGDKMEMRRKKKTYYAKLKKEEEDKMSELALKYRDRARERRDGANPDYQADGPDSLTASSGYRAVAPDLKSGIDAAERRKQMIQESKFLGGDMEHTHLVKGLDFALLQKVRSEIDTKEKEKEDEELEEIVSKPRAKPKDVKPEDRDQIQFRTAIGRNVYDTVFGLNVPKRNDLFMSGRMAYAFDLEEEFADSDIPTTVVRSKGDCPNIENQMTLSTNDIVINKLTQILSYLRAGSRHGKKQKKKDKGKSHEDGKKKNAAKMFDDSIYGDIGEYAPDLKKKESHAKNSRDNKRDDKRRGKEEKPREKKSYFDKPSTEDSSHKDKNSRDSRSSRHQQNYTTAGQSAKTTGQPSVDPRIAAGWSASEIKQEKEFDSNRKTKLVRMMKEPDGYAECYPGMPETADAIDDSDEEADYTKMDLGNKKGPIGRWDFDTQEEYSDYMTKREALPKAAFQYGVKMTDGRKTRRTVPGKKDDKAVLDREWQKISKIIAKRTEGTAGGEPAEKRSRMSYDYD